MATEHTAEMLGAGLYYTMLANGSLDTIHCAPIPRSNPAVMAARRVEREAACARSEVRRLRLALDKARHNANAPWTRTYTRLLAAAEAKLEALA